MEQKSMPEPVHKPVGNQESEDQQSAPDRPTAYTESVGDEICGRLVEDVSLQSICAEPGMPNVATVSDWIFTNPEFRERYAFARGFQAHCIAPETIKLADEAGPAWVEKVRNGRVVWAPDRKNFPRALLRIEARHLVVDALLARARQLSTRTLRLVKYLADEEWECNRYKRHKIFLIERRFNARLAYQAYREKAAQENKAALAKTLAERQSAPLTLPEEALDGLIAEIDAMLLRPAQELDHARALEVGIVYFQHLDRLLNAAIDRRNAILTEIERCDHFFDPPLTISAELERDHACAVLEWMHAAGDGPRCNEQQGSAQAGKIAPPLAPGQEDRS
jgi:hypothetical protein